MAKKTKRTRPPTKPGGERGPDGPSLTAELKRLDRELVRLFSDRARLAGKMGDLRQEEGSLSDGFVQDDEVLARALEMNQGPLSDETLRAVFRELNSGARSLLKRSRIAFLGPLYSYSHLAAMRRFGQSVEFAPVGTIAAVFEEVDRGQSDYGIVPFENSTDGRIADTLDMFTRLPVRICGQVRLDIHHALLGKCPRTEIKEVYSRPQALSQCRNWLARHLPAARPIEVTSTSTAAQLAKEKPGAAAIASLEAGVNYGLDVLAERIEDNPNNRTWFAIIGDHIGKRTGNDHTAIMFQTEHRFGALADVLAIFKRNRINLTWIESFPVPGTQRVYLFFVELEGHEQDARFRRAVAALERRTLRMEILGSYPVDTSTD